MKLILALLLLISNVALAETKMSLMGSVNFNNPEYDLDASGIDEKSDVGFGIGMRALMGINDQLKFRSGASIVKKKVGLEIDTASVNGKADISVYYLNIPLTLYWQASPQVGFFGGTALNAKLADEVKTNGDMSSDDIDDSKAVVFPAIVGFDFNFNEKFGMEISYEYGMMETAKDVKIHTAVASFLYHL